MYKKNLMKLFPAVAVIIAIAAAGFQQDSEVKSTKTVQAAENELIKSDELTSLLTTVYFNDGGMKDTDEADSSILKTKKSKSKIKKRELRQEKPKHFRKSQQQLPGRGRERPRHLQLLFQRADIKMELTKEVEPDLVERSLFR